MQRRNFIKAGCLACAGLITLGTLEACSTLPLYKATLVNGKIDVPESTMAEGKPVIVRHKDLDFDVLLLKNSNGYKALYMKCTHEDAPLVATESGLYCNMHGSAFNLEGAVTKEPATKPLASFETTVANNLITINIHKQL